MSGETGIAIFVNIAGMRIINSVKNSRMRIAKFVKNRHNGIVKFV